MQIRRHVRAQSVRLPRLSILSLLFCTATTFGQSTGETEACCGPFAIGCADFPPSQCKDIGGDPAGPGTQCEVDDPCFFEMGLACCDDGECFDNVPPFFCREGGGVPQEPGVSCKDADCDPNIQACCLDPLAALNCGNAEPDFCIEIGGTPAGNGTQCDVDDPCDTAPRPCCFDDGSCNEFLPPAFCELDGGTPQPVGLTCKEAQCGQATEACCVRRIAQFCIDIPPNECLDFGGESAGPGTQCAIDDPCEFIPRACCLPDGTCTILEPLFCAEAFGGVPQEPGSTCDDVVCDDTPQACCFGPIAEFPCVDAPPNQCINAMGEPAGTGTECFADDPCDTKARACCLPDGSCAFFDPHTCAEIANGEPQEPGTTCDDVECGDEAPEACCISPIAALGCVDVPPSLCPDFLGEPAGPGTQCFVNDPCDFEPRACCLPDGGCAFLDPQSCAEFAGGEPQESGTTCDDVECEKAPQACCIKPIAEFQCVDVPPSLCPDFLGEPAGPGTRCFVDDPCDFEPRACCLPDGGCSFTDPQTCAEMKNGEPQEAGTTCNDVDCGEVPEACCISPLAALFCVNVPPSMCPDFKGKPAGPGTECFVDDPCDFIPRACCLPDGGCAFLDPQSCAEVAGGDPQESGTACQDVVCIGTAPEIVHFDSVDHGTFPCSGYIDPRAESNNGQDVNQGIRSASILFNMRVFGSPRSDKLIPANFVMTETGGGDPPVVLNVFPTDDVPERVIVLWDRPLTPGEWTTIRAVVFSLQGLPIKSLGNLGPGEDEPDRIDIASLPGDVDQSGIVTPIDLFVFRQIANGLCKEGVCPDCDGQLSFSDINRDNNLSPMDLFRYRQLINGTGNATQSWDGQFLSEPQP